MNFKKILEDLLKKQQSDYSQKLDEKTMKYQRKFNFELNPLEGHRTWNVEADAFKHAYMGADLALNKGQIGSLAAGIFHENQTKNNPPGEWNMDSWNNAEGRKIAKEMKEEYGNKLKSLPEEHRDAVIASKIMLKMRNGELITNPNDSRQYKGFWENVFNKTGKPVEVPTLDKINRLNKPFTREQIGAMSTSEFKQNESEIMKQLKNNQIKSEFPDFSKVSNSQDNRIFTREDIKNMTSQEYSANENDIMNQLKTSGIPTIADLNNNPNVIYVPPYIKADGTKVSGYYRRLA